jgi:hypothetical protein
VNLQIRLQIAVFQAQTIQKYLTNVLALND